MITPKPELHAVKQALKQGFALEFMSGTSGFCSQYAPTSQQIFVTPTCDGGWAEGRALMLLSLLFSLGFGSEHTAATISDRIFYLSVYFTHFFYSMKKKLIIMRVDFCDEFSQRVKASYGSFEKESLAHFICLFIDRKHHI